MSTEDRPESESETQYESPEQLLAFQAKAKQLLSTDVDFNRITTTMIVADRLYNMARASLTRYCEVEDLERLFETYVTEAMGYKAADAYTIDSLITNFQSFALPFMNDELQRMQSAQRTATLVAAKQKQTSPISVRFDLANGVTANIPVKPGHMLLLCGSADKLNSAMEQIAGATELSLFYGDEKSQDTVSSRDVVRMFHGLTESNGTVNVELSDWTGVGSRFASWRNFTHKIIKQHKIEPVLWLVSSIGLLGNYRPPVGKSMLQCIKETIVLLARWAGKQNTIVVAGHVLPHDSADHPETYSQLREITDSKLNIQLYPL